MNKENNVEDLGVSPAIAKQVLAAVVSDATHLLRCRHCIGTNCKEYYMACIPLGETKNGKMKVLVFGDRNWAGKDHLKRIRYVEPYRVFVNGG